ncbi:hypothetical protein VNO77_06307 [Canavalia gladiata]|uniref:ABC transporter domain-containing protein n=1 Tax=Canavalia gladiata TaxID=3824 RepID=A0AAN9MC00_CANGL
MERSDIYRASNTLRFSSSTFSRSSRHEEDDEQALRWAALEKLPTYNRLRKGFLTNSDGLTKEIDITDLGFQERKELLDRLINVAEEDNQFLLKLKERIDRVGIDIPTIEVRYEHLNIEAEAYVGSRALPTFLNFATNIVESFFTSLHILSSKKKQVSILKDVSGIVKPSRMTLLLGPPSSGKTTLLLALSGKLDPNLKVSGRVTYNGHAMEEFVPQRTAAYISQNDVHIAEMTVRETLAFSARCQGVGTRYDLLSELSRREKEAKIKPDPDIDVYMKAATTGGQEANIVTDYVLKILGLDICADTIVGDEMLRGISGGQRKRVTTGEMLVGPANALFMDEISTGLDSSTTFQIVRSLRQYVHILNGTALISLLQPAPETYELFDDIVLISDGQIVYQGPREYVLDFFEYMGFKCPQRKGVADFLQEVTSRKDQEQYWMRKDEPYRFVDVTQFVEAFQPFHVGRRIGEELAIPFDKSKNHPAALTTKRYGVNKKELLKANFSREYLLMKRNSFVYIFKLCQLIFMAILTMTIFLRTEMHRDSLDDGGVYAGALFFAVVAFMFNGMAELSMTIVKLPVFYKHRDLLFYPSWAYVIPSWILKIPITFIEAAVWMASGLFRVIAAIARNMIVANTFSSIGLLVLFTLGGFILSKKDIKSWWIWGYWISPIMYGQNAIMVNEFLGNRSGALIGFIFLFNLLYTLALTYQNTFEKPQATATDQSGTMLNDRTGEDELTRLGSGHGKKRGMVLPFEPYSIIFDQIVYSVDMPQLLLMKRGGQEIYVGPLGCHSCQLINYFESIEGVNKIKDGYNPATWMLQVTTQSQELTLGVDFHEIYRSSELYSSSRQNLFNAIGSIYIAILFVGVQNATSVQPVIAVERTVFYRERAAGMYSALPYAIAQVIIELPYIFVQAASYGVLVYAMMGFEWTLEKFFWYVFFLYFTLCYFTFYGMMTVAITPNYHVASIVGAAFYGIWNLFSGFVIPQPNIPVWWRWYYWACPFAWTVHGLVASQFGDITDVMKSENKSVQEFIRIYFGIKHNFLGVCAIMVSGFALVFVFIFAVSIKTLNFQKR